MFQSQAAFLTKMDAASANVRVMSKPTPNQIATIYADAMGYIAFMARRGFPETRTRACLADRTGIDHLVKATNEAERTYGVAGTPAFVINGKKVDNVYTWARLRPVLAAMGA